MSTHSSIEWTEATWNPVTGCTRVSKGCDNCYAVSMTRRLDHIGQSKYKGLINAKKKHFNGIVKLHRETLDIPIRRHRPTVFFVNSMSDLFHKDIPFHFIQTVFDIIAKTPQHTYQILTKRPERMANLLPQISVAERVRFSEKPLKNVWLGTSVEDQETANQRVPLLQRTPAAIRFLSCEPLLGPIDLGEFLCNWSQPELSLHWVIVGGESGPNARELKKQWVVSIRQQCQRSKIPFFFKQWGGRNRKQAGRLLDGKTYDDMPN